jgi:hypothetical protein
VGSFAALENVEHVVGGLSQIVVGVDFWKWGQYGGTSRQ